MGKLGAALFATFGSGVSLVDAFLGLVSFFTISDRWRCFALFCIVRVLYH
jgi:hypothetical protein